MLASSSMSVALTQTLWSGEDRALTCTHSEDSVRPIA
jgi:hypothetical protein